MGNLGSNKVRTLSIAIGVALLGLALSMFALVNSVGSQTTQSDDEGSIVYVYSVKITCETLEIHPIRGFGPLSIQE